jgi:hypothetical protein
MDNLYCSFGGSIERLDSASLSAFYMVLFGNIAPGRGLYLASVAVMVNRCIVARSGSNRYGIGRCACRRTNPADELDIGRVFNVSGWVTLALLQITLGVVRLVPDGDSEITHVLVSVGDIQTTRVGGK